MTRIGTITLGRMSNGAHFRFMRTMLENAKEVDALMARAPHVVDALAKAFDKEERVFKVSQKSMLTDEIVAADRERGNLYMAFKKMVKGMRRMPVKSVAAAATRLQQKLVDYNINVRAQLDQETGMMESLLSELLGPLRPDVELLGLMLCVQHMKEANDRVDLAMTQRDEDRKYIVTGATRAARLACDDAYRNLVLVVNALVVMDGESAYRDFVAYANAMIARTKREVLGSPAEAGNEKQDSPDE